MIREFLHSLKNKMDEYYISIKMATLALIFAKTKPKGKSTHSLSESRTQLICFFLTVRVLNA